MTALCMALGLAGLAIVAGLLWAACRINVIPDPFDPN